jgi:DNA-binding XRE family transcriptional regulator
MHRVYSVIVRNSQGPRVFHFSTTFFIFDLRKVWYMKKKKRNIMTLDKFKDKHYGKHGTSKREKLESGYENFRIGALLQEARHEKGLTQEELAEKAGTTKSYISKIENEVKEVRISTLLKIVEVGLGGRVYLSIKL